MPIDVEAYKNAMAQFPLGVTIVTAEHANQRLGITVSAFCSVSLEPPLVLVCIEKDLATHALIERSAAFAVNVLHKGQLAWGQRFAGLLPETEDRFEGITCEAAVTGAPLLPGVLSWLDCRVYATYTGGDHTIFVGEVVAASTAGGAAPLLYYDRHWRELAADPLT